MFDAKSLLENLVRGAAPQGSAQQPSGGGLADILGQVLQGGGFTSGGTNFDAKLRRQSIDPQDLLIGHIGGMDSCARGLRAAAKMIEDKALSGPLEARYQNWSKPEPQKMLAGGFSLEEIEAWVRKADLNPKPVSGRQELLENVVNQYV